MDEVPCGGTCAVIDSSFRFITEDGEAIASSNGGVFLTYKMMTK